MFELVCEDVFICLNIDTNTNTNTNDTAVVDGTAEYCSFTCMDLLFGSCCWVGWKGSRKRKKKEIQKIK